MKAEPLTLRTVESLPDQRPDSLASDLTGMVTVVLPFSFTSTLDCSPQPIVLALSSPYQTSNATCEPCADRLGFKSITVVFTVRVCRETSDRAISLTATVGFLRSAQ